jgi:dTDP-4-dehydrorhamnose reductase
MRVLVTGAAGMLGREVVKTCAEAGYDYIAFDRHEFDVSDPWQVGAIKDLGLSVVINCAGVTKGRDVPASRYVAVNALGPHLLAEACDRCGARLIHVSTDCVFSGQKTRWYTEDDTPDPVDLYGRSKLAGEVARAPHLTVRSSFIGFGERGLLAWLMRQTGNVPGYDGAMWNGLTAPVLARELARLAGRPEATGVLHLGTNRGVSKGALLAMCVEAMELPCNVVSVPTPAERKAMRCLYSLHPARKDITVPTLEEMIVELARERP